MGMAVRGKVAVVTGAASGIGRAIAMSLAARGCHLALADVNEAGLHETAARLGSVVRISLHRIDVSDRAAVAAFPDRVVAAHGGVDILVNNAGVALGGRFDQVTEADFDWLLSINFHGLVSMTRAFLPRLEQRPESRIVNLSSIFGIIAPPGQAAYAASKFAVRGFSEALRNELAMSRSPVGVTVVHPGGIRTAIADNARVAANTDPEEERRQRAHFAAVLKMPPEKAGEIIVRGLIARRPRVLVGNDAKLVALIERLLPVGYWRLLTWLGLA
ncbi:SDR family oxidoreductase [Novosphingobium sp.]|uniref:SDR family NAD(P)-dependent oxidoreductase n=1 Tax=Novosphingobium sp. TaxID=1874826 RepID=UPI0026366E19|nr:SDR family NAD(P)-dependent oxidoreductase [Novosphingobium sp.]